VVWVLVVKVQDCGRPRSQSARAREAYLTLVRNGDPYTQAKRAKASENEERLAKAIAGTRLNNSRPFDVVAGKTGLEVKTLLTGKNDKLTVHQSSIKLKQKYMKKHGLTHMYTVAIDNRNGGEKVYIREGTAAYRLTNMFQLKKLSDVGRYVV
jgi:hypothetical protein